jgi:hypothetical protein
MTDNPSSFRPQEAGSTPVPDGAGGGGSNGEGIDAQMAKFLDGVTGVVEANSFECQMLWEENQRLSKRTWKSSGAGLMEVVGSLADMPVCISLFTAEVAAQKILFLDPTSQVVDHRMIDEWLEKTLPLSARREDGRVNRANAQNFHNIFRRPLPAPPATPTEALGATGAEPKASELKDNPERAVAEAATPVEDRLRDERHLTQGDGLAALLATAHEAADTITDLRANLAAAEGERDALLAESHELTKALTGLTCGGSEFFIRKGDRYIADIKACVDYVRRRDTDAHSHIVRAITGRQAAEADRDQWKADAAGEFIKRRDAEERVRALEAGLEAARQFIVDEYADARASALEGEPLAKTARPVFATICSLLSSVAGGGRNPTATTPEGSQPHD